MAQPYPDYTDFARALEELTARSVTDQVRAAQRFRELLQRVATGEVDVVTLRAECDRLVAEQGGQLGRDLTSLGVQYYQAMLDLSRAYVDRLFDELGVAAGHSSSDGHTADPHAAPTIVELRLRGSAGDVVEEGFLVENKRGEPADVSFLVSEFTSTGGGAFRAELELDPPRLRLEPHEEQAVTLRLQLDPGRFVPGGQYEAQVLVRGTDDLELRIIVEVDQVRKTAKKAAPRKTASPD